MTPQADQPRVRPIVWRFALVMSGIGLLVYGEHQGFFVGALTTGSASNSDFYLLWTASGAIYSLLAAYAWTRMSANPGKVRLLIVFLALSAIMVGGSQFAARKTLNSVFVNVERVQWDSKSEEFVIHASCIPAIAHALDQGDLNVLLSIYGLSTRRSSSPLRGRPSTTAVKFYVAVWGDASGLRSPPSGQRLYSNLVSIRPLRLPWKPPLSWKPDGMKPLEFSYTDVAAVLTNRQGQRIGIEARVQLMKSSIIGSQ